MTKPSNQHKTTAFGPDQDRAEQIEHSLKRPGDNGGGRLLGERRQHSKAFWVSGGQKKKEEDIEEWISSLHAATDGRMLQ